MTLLVSVVVFCEAILAAGLGRNLRQVAVRLTDLAIMTGACCGVNPAASQWRHAAGLRTLARPTKGDMMSNPSFSMAIPNGVDLNNPWCQVAFALSVLGALPPLVMSILKVLREPEIQAAGRWMAAVARRAWAAVQASLAVPNSRRHRPIADMALALMEGTLYYLLAMTFMAWFVFGVLLIAARWGSLSPATYAALFAYEMAMALLVRFYAERGRRVRVDLRRRWRAIQRRRWQAAMAMACVPLAITLITVGTELIRSSNAAA